VFPTSVRKNVDGAMAKGNLIYVHSALGVRYLESKEKHMILTAALP
jgi:hypothetical protein